METNQSHAADVDELMLADDGVSIVKPDASALEAITRSEISMQLEAAHRFPRSTQRFLREAGGLATLSREVAESCMYSLPRGGKILTGPSVRLAEIIASRWGNLHVGARVIDETESVVIAQAIAWDLQHNLRITVEAQRGIKKSNGRRYDDDMIRVTGMAAMAIARRNVIFTVVPRAYVDQIYNEARACAVGDAKTLAERREDWLARLSKMGVSPERVFARLGIAGAADITLDHGVTLIGLSNAIRKGESQVDEAFPPVVTTTGASAPAAAAATAPPGAAPPAASAPEGRRVSVGTGKRGRPPASARNASEPPPGPAKNQQSAAAPHASEPPAPPPAAASGKVDPAALVLALALIDDGWKAAPDGAQIVASWTEAERAEAWRWTQAILNDSAPMAVQLNRPAFTNIDEPPEAESEVES